MDWNLIAIISSLATIVLFLPSFFRDIVSPIISYYELRRTHFKLLGSNWLSTWQPKAANEPDWIVEKITIVQGKFGKVILKNDDNSEGYSFTCIGKVYNSDNCKFLYGYWTSNSTEDDKRGRFLLTINPRGFMIGNFFGPNTQGIMMTGGWILARNDYQLQTAKLLYEKGYLSDDDSKFLKKIKERFT